MQGPSVKAQGGEEGAPGNSDMGKKGEKKGDAVSGWRKNRIPLELKYQVKGSSDAGAGVQILLP